MSKIKRIMAITAKALSVLLITLASLNVKAQMINLESAVNCIGKISSGILTEIRNTGYDYDRLHQNQPCTIHKKMVAGLSYQFMVCDKSARVYRVMYNEDLQYQEIIFKKIIALGFKEVKQNGSAEISSNRSFTHPTKNVNILTEAVNEDDALYIVVKSDDN